MGIRFRCHQCGHELHVKDFQGGKRGKCPACAMRFRIPQADADYSIPLDDAQIAASHTNSSATAASVASSGGVRVQSPTVNAPAVKSTTVAPSSKLVSTPSPATGEKSRGATETADSAAIDSPLALEKSSKAVSKVSSDKLESSLAVQSSEAAAVVDNAATSDDNSAVSAIAAARAKVPQAIAEAPGATWYVRPPSGGQFGPAPADVFHEWLNENRVTRDSLVWRDGWPQWLVATDVFADFFGPALPATSVTTTTPSAVSLGSTTTTNDSTGDRTRLARKLKRRRRYIIGIAVLATLAVVLVVALIIVLMKN